MISLTIHRQWNTWKLVIHVRKQQHEWTCTFCIFAKMVSPWYSSLLPRWPPLTERHLNWYRTWPEKENKTQRAKCTIRLQCSYYYHYIYYRTCKPEFTARYQTAPFYYSMSRKDKRHEDKKIYLTFLSFTEETDMKHNTINLGSCQSCHLWKQYKITKCTGHMSNYMTCRTVHS